MFLTRQFLCQEELQEADESAQLLEEAYLVILSPS